MKTRGLAGRVTVPGQSLGGGAYHQFSISLSSSFKPCWDPGLLPMQQILLGKKNPPNEKNDNPSPVPSRTQNRISAVVCDQDRTPTAHINIEFRTAAHLELLLLLLLRFAHGGKFSRRGGRRARRGRRRGACRRSGCTPRRRQRGRIRTCQRWSRGRLCQFSNVSAVCSCESELLMTELVLRKFWTWPL